ncbi:MAG: hypothetical protein ACXVPU_04625 [Bacteroidia bacterium]
MKKIVRTFFLKLLIFSTPFLIILATYIYLDPFKVIFKYDSYFKSGKPSYVSLDIDYVSTQNFINKYPKYKFDSFIFGNSRSRFYEINEWKKYISSDRCYHFDASAETLFGIDKKVEYLNNNNINIKNALIVWDVSALRETSNSKGHLYIKHPILTNESSMSFHFQFEFFKMFMYPKFLMAYSDFMITKKFKPYMKDGLLLDDKPFDYDSVSNEMSFSTYEKMISKNKEDFYIPRARYFYKRDTSIQKISEAVIQKEQIEMLNYIKSTFDKDKTNYQIVINPLYDQLKLNPKDLEVLQTIFGKDKVHDYSGINEITNNIYNYYETSHYRPHTATKIMQEIYAPN